MRILKRILATVLLALVTVSAQAAPDDNAYLLKTHWYQDGPFAAFTPNNERVGCWSTAYAQILYHHRLTPHGRVNYECSTGYRVDVDLDQYRFDWDHFPDAITAGTPKADAEQPARYSFATAVVVRKDFGTGKYKRLINSVEDLEAHFAVDAEIYVHLGENLPVSPADLEAQRVSEKISHVIDRAQIVALLTTELTAHRPVYFHFANFKEFGHSTVIDGIRNDGDQFMVHLNYGAVEPEMSRWYELFAPIAQADDVNLRAFVTIKPLGSHRCVPDANNSGASAEQRER